MEPPSGALTATVVHRVAFYETDAMGVVHHSNYLRFFEAARVHWLELHDQPYRAYMKLGLHFATTRAEVDYRRSAHFDERLGVTTWMESVGGASLRMAYRIEGPEGQLLVTGLTEHAAVDLQGRVRRIPRERRALLRASCGTATAASATSARRHP